MVILVRAVRNQGSYWLTSLYSLSCLYTCTVNARESTTIPFRGIWWIHEFGGLTGYSLVLVHYVGTGKLWWIKRFVDKAMAD